MRGVGDAREDDGGRAIDRRRRATTCAARAMFESRRRWAMGVCVTSHDS